MVQVTPASFEILTPLSGQDVLKHIERCGRTCYQSFDKMGEATHTRFAAHIVERHHESVLEHFSISVKFIIDRAIANELTRHRMASFSQESTRYCCYSKDKFKGEITVIRPIEMHPQSKAYQYWFDLMLEIEKTYLKLIELGEKAETARAVLPCCLKTEIVATANLREWRHIFKMRCSDAAHPDIRYIMRQLRDEMKRQIPIVFDDLEDKA